MTAFMEASNLAFAYGKQEILKGVSFSVQRGEFISIIGTNGSGKTTLFHLLNGYNKPKSGRVLLEGRDLASISISNRAKEITIVHQHQDCNFPFSCFEMVIMGIYPHKTRFERVDEKTLVKIEEIMKLTDTLRFAKKEITQISGGERQRVVLARALAQKPQLLLLDEAMSDLDIYAKIEMTKVLREYVKKHNMTVIGINHDLNTAYKFSDRIIALQKGEIVADGTPSEVITEEFLKRVFRVKGEVFGEKGFFIHDNILKVG